MTLHKNLQLATIAIIAVCVMLFSIGQLGCTRHNVYENQKEIRNIINKEVIKRCYEVGKQYKITTKYEQGLCYIKTENLL